MCPSASTRATRLRTSAPSPALWPGGPRTGMHFTVCVSKMAKRGSDRRPAPRRRNRTAACSAASNDPTSVHRLNQPLTVRHGGHSRGKARQGPPAHRREAAAPTTVRIGARRPLPGGGSARSSQSTTSPAAGSATTCFRRASCAPDAPWSTSPAPRQRALQGPRTQCRRSRLPSGRGLSPARPGRRYDISASASRPESDTQPKSSWMFSSEAS